MEATRTELLVRLLSAHQGDLFRYVFALLPQAEDAGDVLQETSVALYRKFEEYDPAKPFLPWAFGFAFVEVLKHRQRERRARRLLSDKLVEQLARDRQQHEPMLEARLVALPLCLEQLPARDRELIRQRYQEKASADELMHEFGASRRTLFRKLDRIRRWLHDCINRRVAATGAS